MAGTAAGAGVFFQSFLGAVFSQIYGLLADGTPRALGLVVAAGAVGCFVLLRFVALPARPPAG